MLAVAYTERWHLNAFRGVPVTRFHGEIDAIRISSVARYDIPGEGIAKAFDPPSRFSADEHTLALWNFDDKLGAIRFRDASGHGKTLIGKNGASIGKPFAVNLTSTSPTTTWGKSK